MMPKKNRLLQALQKANIVRWLGLDRYKMQIIIIGAIALFVVTNIALMPVSLRLDLSKGKAYTLSGSTKKIVSNLKDPVTITFFVSSDLPTRLHSLRRDVVDLLQEYDRANGKVDITIVDPKTDTKAAQKAQEAGIQELQFSQLQQDSYALNNFYFGILISYKDQKEALPQATDLGSLEYNITSAIYKLTNDSLPKVAIAGQQPQIIPQLPSALGTFTTVAERQFGIEFITPPEQAPAAEGEPTPTPVPMNLTNDFKALLVFDKDTGDYSDTEIAQFKDYIAKKGNVIFFVDGLEIDPRQLTAAAGESKLVQLIKEYGIEVQPNLVLSENSELINAGNQSFTVYLPYPFWITTNNVNQDVSYVSNVNQLSYLWASSLNLNNKINNTTVRQIVSSTPQSWVQSNNFVLNPQQIAPATETQYKESVLTAESVNENRGKVMVISSARFITDEFQSRAANNLEFVLNVLNDYASEGALSGIRQRQIDIYPLPNIPPQMQQIFKYGNILVLPGIFALYGVYRLMKRNKKEQI
ncbi:MAG TPA: GldG family protein [Candidatus Woesebacteria bacterium]|nr:GldG family protein [Candidatus Woesebacteria bacterium]